MKSDIQKTDVRILKKFQCCEMFFSGGRIFIIFHIKTIMFIVRSTASKKYCGSYCTRSASRRQKIVFGLFSLFGRPLAKNNFGGVKIL